MTKNEVKYRRVQLETQAGRLLKHDRDGFKKLSQEKQGELHEILLELIGMDIKISGHQDDGKNNPVPRIRNKKKTSKNQQLILTF